MKLDLKILFYWFIHPYMYTNHISNNLTVHHSNLWKKEEEEQKKKNKEIIRSQYLQNMNWRYMNFSVNTFYIKGGNVITESIKITSYNILCKYILQYRNAMAETVTVIELYIKKINNLQPQITWKFQFINLVIQRQWPFWQGEEMAKNGPSKILGCSEEMENPADCGTPIDGCWIELPRRKMVTSRTLC